MKQLFERIIAWHEKNLPAGLPYEALPQIGFLLEELHEANKEFISGNTDKAVGEICDLIVFSVNAMALIEYGKMILDFDFTCKKYKELVSNIDVIKQLTMSIYSVMSNIKDELLLSIAYGHLIDNCCRSINALGYSPEIALEETVKKIESRRGEWDASIGKWVKEKNQPDVYVPDYSLARLS